MRRLALIIGLLWSSSAWAAIANDSGYPWTSAITTTNHSVTTAGDNRLVVVVVSLYGVQGGDPTATVSGNTWGSFTQSVASAVAYSNPHYARSYIFTKWVASAGTNTVTLSLTLSNYGGWEIFVLSGASSTLGASGTLSNTNIQNPSVNLTTQAANSYVVAGVGGSSQGSWSSNMAGCTLDSATSEWYDNDYASGHMTALSSNPGQSETWGINTTASNNAVAGTILEILIGAGNPAATPTSSPPAESYERGVIVALGCTSPSPTIRYTTDGSTPTGSSTVYSIPLSFTSTTPLKAICQSSGYDDSAVMSATYWIAGGAVGRLASRPTRESEAGYVFYDSFEGSVLDAGKWTAVTRQGDYTGSEDVCYNPSQVSVSGGNLVIQSVYQTTSCGDSTHQPANHPVLSGFVYMSRFTFTYGTVEWRGTIGAGANGPWTSVWLLGHNCQAGLDLNAESGPACSWPDIGSDEIDLSEFMGSATSDNQAVHTNGTDYAQPTTVTDANVNVHTYQLVWSAGSLVWKVDGTTTLTVTQSWVPSTAMFVIISIAAGGQGGTPQAGSYPKTSTIQYVKITQP